ncbi:hypothetical protein AB9X41_21115 [Ralstonia solanacearum]|uniref:hypothetical protein n=1 Tax=Ralstonia solanacearum TaxID=305 RepID=UPI0035193DAF
MTVITAAISGADYFSAIKAAENNAQAATSKALSAYDECRKELSAPRPTDSQLADQAKGNGLDAYLAQGMLADVQRQPAGTTPKSATSVYDQFLSDACGYAAQSRTAFTVQQAREQDVVVRQARDEAIQSALQSVAWVSGLLGGTFMAVGWVRRGFRRKNQN